MTKPTIIKSARPNRYPIRLVSYTNDEGTETVFEVQETDEEGYWEEGFSTESLQVAEQAFEKRCKELSQTPNWEAQAQYDEQHGTDNGYPILPRREY